MVQKLLREREAAELLGVAPATLTSWRCRQTYPLPFVRVGRCIRYREADLERFVESRREPGDGAQASGR
jgi:predicted site-specific integrase-resolvase